MQYLNTASLSFNFGKCIFRVNRSCFMLSSKCPAFWQIHCVVCVVNNEFPAEMFFKTLSIYKSFSVMVMTIQKNISSYLTVAHSSTSHLLRVQCVYKCSALSATECKSSC